MKFCKKKINKILSRLKNNKMQWIISKIQNCDENGWLENVFEVKGLSPPVGQPLVYAN